MTSVLTADRMFRTILLALAITNVVPPTATPITTPRANLSMVGYTIMF